MALPYALRRRAIAFLRQYAAPISAIAFLRQYAEISLDEPALKMFFLFHHSPNGKDERMNAKRSKGNLFLAKTSFGKAADSNKSIEDITMIHPNASQTPSRTSPLVPLEQPHKKLRN